MKAIVLTCDRFRAVTDHMIGRYAKLWPDHPFRFRVPYQELGPTAAAETVDYKKSPLRIKATVLTLLEDLDGEEMVYWCIDDKYPIKLDVPRIGGMLRWLAGESASTVSGILFCRCRKMLDSRFLTEQTVVDDAEKCLPGKKRICPDMAASVSAGQSIAYLFESFPDSIPAARAMDELKKRVKKPSSHRVFVSRENAAVFGESTSHGVLTQNCHRSILENGLALPDWCSSSTNEEIVMGELDD